jgi:hypothetical protein
MKSPVTDRAYTQVDEPRQALVEVGTIELTEAVHTDDRKMLLESSPEVEGAQSRVTCDGEAGESTPGDDEVDGLWHRAWVLLEPQEECGHRVSRILTE